MLLPKISIITVNLNGAYWLERAIKSIVSQNYSNSEYIIIDGGSTDGSHVIFDKYRDQIDRLVIEKDNGISDAFNKGLRYATGEIIGIISADDYLEHGALGIVAEFFATHNEPDIVYGNAGYLLTNERLIVRPEPIRKIWWGQPLKHVAVFVKKSTYDKYGMFNDLYKFAMDYDLILRFYVKGARFEYLNQTLSTFSGGGANELNIIKTINESKRISITYGMSPFIANLIFIWKYTKVKMKEIISSLGLDFLLRLYRKLSNRYL